MDYQPESGLDLLDYNVSLTRNLIGIYLHALRSDFLDNERFLNDLEVSNLH